MNQLTSNVTNDSEKQKLFLKLQSRFFYRGTRRIKREKEGKGKGRQDGRKNKEK
jgi:hypothetical protein